MRVKLKIYKVEKQIRCQFAVGHVVLPKTTPPLPTKKSPHFIPAGI